MRGVWIALLWLSCCAVIWAADPPLQAFFGEYIGSTAEQDEPDRDLSVAIRPAADGDFQVQWTTVIHRDDGRSKRKSYQIRFTPTARARIYASAMRTNVFGGKSSLDPIQGEPLFWARIRGDTLTVNAFMITDDGGYSMQIYNRTLSPKGLQLEYIRKNSDGSEVRIDAALVRVAD